MGAFFHSAAVKSLITTIEEEPLQKGALFISS